MYDRFNRKIDYLRISVTDRCNLRCIYCMPEEGVVPLQHSDILTYEEIIAFVKVAITMGIHKIRLTGGEPLVRKGVVHLVENLSELEGIKDLSMTTNGILMEEFALPLKKAGLQRVNISLDTLDPERYSELTRGGDVHQVIRGIGAAKRVGLLPVKINCVIGMSSDESDARLVSAFCREQGLQVRFIRRMDLASGHFSAVEGGDGGRCNQCNRLRLTADGKVKPCLFSDLEYDVRSLGPERALRMAVSSKPASGTYSLSGKFYTTGG